MNFIIFKLYSSKFEPCFVDMMKTSAIDDKSRVLLNVLCLARVRTEWKKPLLRLFSLSFVLVSTKKYNVGFAKFENRTTKMNRVPSYREAM